MIFGRQLVFERHAMAGRPFAGQYPRLDIGENTLVQGIRRFGVRFDDAADAGRCLLDDLLPMIGARL